MPFGWNQRLSCKRTGFGKSFSALRGDETDGSDLDFLVIEREVDDRVAEAVRLRRALGDLGVPVDVVVLDERVVARRAKVPRTMAYHALREGRVVAES